MARLIDADNIIKILNVFIENTNDIRIYKDYNHAYRRCKKLILDEPIAYDIDDVVEELEENSVMRANSKTFYDNPQKGEYVDEVVLLSKAIEIVKKGGNDIKNTKIHLCDSCNNHYPECDSKEVEFGNGIGNDNIIKCDCYVKAGGE